VTRRRNLVIAAVVVAAAALYWFVIRDRGGDDEAATPDETGDTKKRGAVSVSLPEDPRAPGLDVLVDRDREGDLRLEGQVIDDLEDPVAGAVVSISSNPERSSVTGEDGTFAFDRLVGRPYTLVARTDTTAAGPVTTVLTATSEPVILRTRAANTVEVRVVRADDRRPLAGAAVELRGLFTQSATTGDDGVARLSGVPPGRYQVAARADGYAPDFDRMFVMTSGASHRAELVLRPGVAVSGRVVDPSGAPVSGARVIYRSVSDRQMRAHPRFDAQVSGDDGGFRFPALPAGTFRFSADHDTLAPGYSEPITLEGSETSGVVVQLGEGAVLAGRVVDAKGSPAASAAVRVMIASNSNGERRFRRPRQTFSDDQGRFEMKALPRGEVRVVALHETATSAAQTADLGGGDRRDVELVLDLDGVIAGVVVDTDGEPVDGAQVRLVPDFRRGRGGRGDRSDIRLRGLSTTITDPGGNFELTGLDEQTYRIQAAPPGVMLRFGGRRGRDAQQVKAGQRDVRVVLPALGAISGRVVYEDGDPATAFTVRAGRGWRGRPTPFASKDGGFRLGELEPQTYALAISGADFGDKRIEDVELAAGATVDLGAITVSRGRRISGTVVDGSGRGVEGVIVTAGSRVRGSGASSSRGGGRFGRGRPTRTAITGDSGEFSIGGVGPGELVVVAEHGTRGRSLPITAPASRESTTGLRLQLMPPGAIAGVVREGSRPIDGARVTAQSQTQPSAAFTVRAGPDGRYRFDVLAPDRYLVTAEVGGRRGGLGVSKATAVTSGDVAQVDLTIEAGDVALVITPVGEGVGVVVMHVVEGPLVASTYEQLVDALANRSGGAERSGRSVGGEPERVGDLVPGPHTACLVVFPASITGRQIFAYASRHPTAVPVVCKAVTVAPSPAEQHVAVEVVVPEAVASP
jgi:sarcosine oxidase gamma subunit